MATKLLDLPWDVQTLVREFAEGWQPTPSAQALKAFHELHPWVLPMAQAWPGFAPGIYKGAPYVGMQDCYKCSRCIDASLHVLRRQWDPEWDSERESSEEEEEDVL